MTAETEDHVIARRAEVLGALCDAVTDLRREIQRLTAAAGADDWLDASATKTALGKIRDLVAQCAKAENLLNESRSKTDGRGGACNSLDLDRARAEIGGKLDRLRERQGPRAVPE